MVWATVPLHKVASLESGFGFPREHQGDENQEFPFFRVSDMNIPGNEVFMENHSNTVSASLLKELGARAFPPGTVIFPKIGAAIATEKKRILTKPSTYDNNVMGAIPRAGVNPKFLYYWFLQLKLTDLANPGHVPSIRKSVMEDILFPVVTSKEQERIVEILDEADYLQRLRREADAKAVRILPTLFLKMFGDPATNLMEWPEKPLSQLIAAVEAGWSAKSEARLRRDNEFGVLKVSAVTSGRFRPEEHKVVHEIDESRSIITPARGDLLFSRANTRELVAASCVVEDDYPQLFLSDKLWRLTPKQDTVSNLFLKELFWRDGIRDKFRASSSGSSGSMLNISQDAMLRTTIPVPPYPYQLKFEKLAWDVMGALGNLRRAEDKVKITWNILLQRAFSGQLTAKWREAHMQELLTEMKQQARTLNLPMPLEYAPLV
jgi:type I restriction enzyme S subunit